MRGREKRDFFEFFIFFSFFVKGFQQVVLLGFLVEVFCLVVCILVLTFCLFNFFFILKVSGDIVYYFGLVDKFVCVLWIGRQWSRERQRIVLVQGFVMSVFLIFFSCFILGIGWFLSQQYFFFVYNLQLRVNRDGGKLISYKRMVFQFFVRFWFGRLGVNIVVGSS